MGFLKEIKYLFRMIKPHRIINAVSIYKQSGWDGIKFHFLLVKDKEKGRNENAVRQYDILPLPLYDTVDQYENIIFKTCEHPKVSIIIPVYNQFPYTYNCLKSIKKYSENIDYEIIVADDTSTDMTMELERVVQGIKVIRNKQNYQFLISCNRASKEANGEYLVFLNNDTQVQKDWLKALLDLLEANSRIGLAGSKLIYPNGLVQEAGGIVWKDGGVLQYGNNRQPGEKELNFLREADYISGASIMIRKSLWEEIGGFDERFSPAYYEDVDLAFEVRRRGYKVVYQPESEVVHFEGVTESLDRERIEKIDENRKKFLEKWYEVLEKYHYQSTQYMQLIQRIRQERRMNDKW